MRTPAGAAADVRVAARPPAQRSPTKSGVFPASAPDGEGGTPRQVSALARRRRPLSGGMAFAASSGTTPRCSRRRCAGEETPSRGRGAAAWRRRRRSWRDRPAAALLGVRLGRRPGAGAHVLDHSGGGRLAEHPRFRRRVGPSRGRRGAGGAAEAAGQRDRRHRARGDADGRRRQPRPVRHDRRRPDRRRRGLGHRPGRRHRSYGSRSWNGWFGLVSLSERGAEALVGDPGRPDFPKNGTSLASRPTRRRSRALEDLDQEDEGAGADRARFADLRARWRCNQRCGARHEASLERGGLQTFLVPPVPLNMAVLASDLQAALRRLAPQDEEVDPGRRRLPTSNSRRRSTRRARLRHPPPCPGISHGRNPKRSCSRG